LTIGIGNGEMVKWGLRLDWCDFVTHAHTHTHTERERESHPCPALVSTLCHHHHHHHSHPYHHHSGLTVSCRYQPFSLLLSSHPTFVLLLCVVLCVCGLGGTYGELIRSDQIRSPPILSHKVATYINSPGHLGERIRSMKPEGQVPNSWKFHSNMIQFQLSFPLRSSLPAIK
jgi:hypothetical protein